MQTHLDLHYDLTESQTKIFLPQNQIRDYLVLQVFQCLLSLGYSPLIQGLSIASSLPLIQ